MLTTFTPGQQVKKWQTNSTTEQTIYTPQLKFEMKKPETPNGFSPSVLDFKVTIFKDGKSSFEFYKKR